MAGDINIFYNDFEEEGTAELEVMIAEQSCRRRGLGRESIEIMMYYAATTLKHLTLRFIVKIGEENQPSIALFKSLGFTQIGEINVFREVNLIMDLSDDVVERLTAAVSIQSTKWDPLCSDQ
eukprot:gene6263-7264_t